MLTVTLPLIEEEFNLTHTQSGFLISLLFLAQALVMFPAGYLSRFFGEKKAVIFSVFGAAILCIIILFTWSYLFLAFILFVLGLFLGTYYPSGVSLIAENFPIKLRGRSMSFHEASSPIGQITAMFLLGSLVKTFGWRYMYLLCVPIGFLISALFWVLVKEDSLVKRENISYHEVNLKQIFSSKVLMLMLIPFTANFICVRGVIFMGPLYLTTVHHIDVPVTAMIMAVENIGGIIGMFTAGFLSDRYGRTKISIIMLTLTGVEVFTYIFAPFSLTLTFILFFCFGFSLLGFIPVIMALISDLTHPKTRTVVIGLFGTVGLGISSAITPVVIGYLADLISFRLAFLFPALTVVLGLVILTLILKLRLVFKSEKY